jgi:16S rRNA (guanine(966)-N(2))-methyltransferase RsmD
VPPAKVRIIGGLWKRTPVPVLAVEGLRPTPDRVRETLFNWLGQDLEGWHCLDLYAGSGALGLEAASRGAARVVLVERDAKAVRMLRDWVERLSARAVEVMQADALGWVARRAQRFDLVFLDPPFGSAELARILPVLPAVLNDGAMVYVESPTALSADAPPLAGVPGLTLHRSGSAGQVRYHLLRYAAPPPPGA